MGSSPGGKSFSNGSMGSVRSVQPDWDYYYVQGAESPPERRRGSEKALTGEAKRVAEQEAKRKVDYSAITKRMAGR